MRTEDRGGCSRGQRSGDSCGPRPVSEDGGFVVAEHPKRGVHANVTRARTAALSCRAFAWTGTRAKLALFLTSLSGHRFP